MNKNVIKKYLSDTFLTEASDGSTPAIALANKLKKENGKQNRAGVKEIGDELETYEKDTKKEAADQKTIPQNKFNAEGEEKTYHDEMEIMNGQEMVQYDRTPNKEFTDRAMEAIEGSSRMGNNPEWANVTADGWGGSPQFGKNLVKKIKASIKKRSEQTPTSKMFGDDWEVVKDKGHKPYALENKSSPDKNVINEGLSEKNTRVITSWVEKLGANEAAVKLLNGVSQTGMVSDLPDSNEYGNAVRRIEALLTKGDLEGAFKKAKSSAASLERKGMSDMMEGEVDEDVMADKNYTHFAIYKPTKQIMNAWNYSDVDNAELKAEPASYFFNDLNDMADTFNTNKISKKDVVIVNRKKLDAMGINPEDIKNWYRPTAEKPAEQEPVAPVAENNKKEPQIKESMKRLKFKKEFNGVGNALKLIPEHYKTNEKVFEMTDGNESYKIRWEGTLTEGSAVVLTAKNNTMVNEDLQKMKHLFNYKSSDTLGTVKGQARIDENKAFEDVWKKTKKLMEGEDIESVEPEKEAPFEEADIKYAPEAKAHIEGTTSTDKGTQAPAPKTGEWEKISKPQAAQAKAHIEGSTSTDKGTQAPAPKTGEWEKIKKGAAPEAKKDVQSGKPTGKETNSAKTGDWEKVKKGGTSASSGDKGTEAPKPKTGDWEDAKKGQAPEAKKHVKEDVKKKVVTPTK